MRRVRVWAEVTDRHFDAYEREARRRGVPVEELVQQTVNCLMRELEKQDETGCVSEEPVGMS